VKRTKRRVRHNHGKSRLRTALQIIVSSLSFSLLYYRIMQMRHGGQTEEIEETAPVIEQTP